MAEESENPQNRGELEEKPDRNPDGTFAEGRAKTGGKVKGTRSFTTKVREALEKIAEGKDYTYEEAFIKSILKKGIVDGDSQIIRLIWNYLDGMPLQKTDITSDGNPIVIPNDVITKYGAPQRTETDSSG